MTDQIHPKFQAIRSAKQFARLMGLAEELHADVLKDPIPHLERASARIGKLMKLLEDIEYQLRGAIISTPSTGPVEYRSIESILHERNLNALRLIREWRDADQPTGDK